MKKQAVKDLMFGGVVELMRNREYYYKSSVGSSYNHWTDEGKVALQEYFDLVSIKIHESDEEEIHTRAKQMVFETLKE